MGQLTPAAAGAPQKFYIYRELRVCATVAFFFLYVRAGRGCACSRFCVPREAKNKVPGKINNALQRKVYCLSVVVVGLWYNITSSVSY